MNKFAKIFWPVAFSAITMTAASCSRGNAKPGASDDKNPKKELSKEQAETTLTNQMDSISHAYNWTNFPDTVRQVAERMHREWRNSDLKLFDESDFAFGSVRTVAQKDSIVKSFITKRYDNFKMFFENIESLRIAQK